MKRLKNTNGRYKRITGRLFAVAVCLAMLCACGETPVKEEEQAADIYDLPLFSDLPDGYSTATPAFWVAESENGGKVFLLGSIHVADETAYRLPQQLMDAYLESDALAVEMDVIAYAADEEAQASDKERTTYADGDTLQNHIDPLMYDELRRYISDHTDDPDLLTSLTDRKPCIWLSALSDIEDSATGLSQEWGIDRHFLQIAHAQEKDVIEIESSASQYDALNRIPDKAYEFLFSAYIYGTEDMAGDTEKITYDAWKSGTLEDLVGQTGEEAVGEADSDYARAISEYYRILYTERNTVMAKAAKSYLDGGKNVFFVVGAEHLFGSTGVIAQLEEEGYRLTRL